MVRFIKNSPDIAEQYYKHFLIIIVLFNHEKKWDRLSLMVLELWSLDPFVCLIVAIEYDGT